MKKQPCFDAFLHLEKKEPSEHIQDPGQSPLGTCRTEAGLSCLRQDHFVCRSWEFDSK